MITFFLFITAIFRQDTTGWSGFGCLTHQNNSVELIIAQAIEILFHF